MSDIPDEEIVQLVEGVAPVIGCPDPTPVQERVAQRRASTPLGGGGGRPRGEEWVVEAVPAPLRPLSAATAGSVAPGEITDHTAIDIEALGQYVFHRVLARVSANVRRVGFRDGRTFGDTMALLHSEVSEALEEYRIQGLEAGSGADGKPVGVASELADVFIRLIDTCDQWGIDLWQAYLTKMAYNETRPYRHGNKRL